jgi:hypothetical protein
MTISIERPETSAVRTPLGVRRSEPQGDLLGEHKKPAIEMGAEALTACLERGGADVRHATGVLRGYSSASFLFSCQRLLRENTTRPGEYGVLMTMGPGSTIDTALVQW